MRPWTFGSRSRLQGMLKYVTFCSFCYIGYYLLSSIIRRRFSMFRRMSLKCSALYLSQFRHNSPDLLATGTRSLTIVGDVYVHPSAKVHPTAKVGRFKFYKFRNSPLLLNNFIICSWTDWSKCLDICKCSYWSWCETEQLYHPWWCWSQGQLQFCNHKHINAFPF